MRLNKRILIQKIQKIQKNTKPKVAKSEERLKIVFKKEKA